MSAQTAQELTEMMRRVVEEGTGTAAQIWRSVGRRQDRHGRDRSARTEHRWFIAFAPADESHRSRSRSSIERTPEFGGTVAAPIAAT